MDVKLVWHLFFWQDRECSAAEQVIWLVDDLPSSIPKSFELGGIQTPTIGDI